MQSIRFVHNQHNNQQTSQIQPHLHKVLKKSLKITLKSATKQKSQHPSLQKYITLPTHRLSKSIVGSGQKKINHSLKNDIDGRLNRVYSMMTKHSQIRLGDSARYNGQNKSKSKLQLYIKVKNDPFSIINQQNPQLYKELPYQLVKKYISSIYQQYQIHDPLSERKKIEQNPSNQTVLTKNTETPLKSNRLNNYRTSTKKKILLLKDNFISQLNNTTKKKQKYNLSTPKKFITQLAHDNLYEKSSAKEIGLISHKKLQLTLKQHENHHYNQQQINLNQESIMFDKNISRFQDQQTGQKHNNSILNFSKHNNTLAQTKLSTSEVNNAYLTMYNSMNNSTLKLNKLNKTLNLGQRANHQKDRKIKQQFRYCFVCQEAILQSNMGYHQIQCQGLNKILSDTSLTFEKLAELVDNKLIKIKKELEETFLKSEQKQTSFKLSQIKQSVVKWIQSINRQINQKAQPQNRRIFDQYNKVNQVIKSSKILKSFELINKLNWFLHLKINFDKQAKRLK